MIIVDLDIITLENKFNVYVGSIKHSYVNGYYFNCMYVHNRDNIPPSHNINNLMFLDAGIKNKEDIYSLAENIVGYRCRNGIFPFCKSKEDVYKILSYFDRTYSSMPNFIYL